MVYIAATSRDRRFLRSDFRKMMAGDRTITDTRELIDDSLGLKFGLGGDLFSATTSFVELSWEKLRVSGSGELTFVAPGTRFNRTKNTSESGDKVGIDLFLARKMRNWLRTTLDVYWEEYDTDFTSRQSNSSTPFNVDISGTARGGRIGFDVEKETRSSNLGVSYTFDRDFFRGSYFAGKDYSKKIHGLEVSVDYRWRYGLSSRFSVVSLYDATFSTEAPDFALTGPDDSRTWSASLELKYAMANNSLLVVSYHRYSYDVSALSAAVVLNVGGKAPKRRKRNNRLMRIADFAR